MTVPSVTAFSASCSANPGSAPRPETSDGSRAARVTTGAGAAEPGLASAGRPDAIPRPAVAARAMMAAAMCRGLRDHAARAPVLLRAMGYMPFGMTPQDTRERGSPRGDLTLRPDNPFNKTHVQHFPRVVS